MTTFTSSPTVDPNDHAAAAAYLMKHKGVTMLIVRNGERRDRPAGIITATTIAEAVAAGKDLDEVRINDLMCREVVP
jgi:CBS domain-containing protein